MLALIFTRKLRPMIIGSSSRWLMLAGMIARPRATSSRTNSAGSPSRIGDELHLGRDLALARVVQLRRPAERVGAAGSRHPRLAQLRQPGARRRDPAGRSCRRHASGGSPPRERDLAHRHAHACAARRRRPCANWERRWRTSDIVRGSLSLAVASSDANLRHAGSKGCSQSRDVGIPLAVRTTYRESRTALAIGAVISRHAASLLPARTSRVTLQLSEDEALQVVGLRHAEQHRMIAALHPLLDHRDVRLRVDRRVVDDLGERRLVDVVRTAAGHERAARVEQLQRAQVDLLVAGSGLRRPPPCSSRTPADRARSCRTARRRRSRPRSSSNTLPTRASTCDAVARGVLPQPGDGVLGDVDRDRLRHVAASASAKPPL